MNSITSDQAQSTASSNFGGINSIPLQKGENMQNAEPGTISLNANRTMTALDTSSSAPSIFCLIIFHFYVYLPSNDIFLL